MQPNISGVSYSLPIIFTLGKESKDFHAKLNRHTISHVTPRALTRYSVQPVSLTCNFEHDLTHLMFRTHVQFGCRYRI